MGITFESWQIVIVKPVTFRLLGTKTHELCNKHGIAGESFPYNRQCSIDEAALLIKVASQAQHDTLLGDDAHV